ncbi:putative S-adenosyl-L-methionine-dependent methyltransferase [Paratrimastix pyriformis]|uniref:Cap-specific mRNA (nucleoside-2'-O-)-methyltransferase 1 n=1 Tax=Paratrimastix pyriformis TaxID=342808 RepID=A0ABQ8UQB3_9EUKA|nr:putative S-adenosyl-L-methionine-dependent methyltransferase [Paratrimastix pyriformis]
MMEKSGWVRGETLGRGDRPSEYDDPIEAAEQAAQFIGSKHGLGFKGAAPTKGIRIDVALSQDEVDLNREIRMQDEYEMISLSDPACLSPDYDWHRGLVLENEEPMPDGRFCEEELVNQLFQFKSAFDDVPPEKFKEARMKANPYERVGKHIFQNRAALKMANLDSIFKFTQTLPCPGEGGAAVAVAVAVVGVLTSVRGALRGCRLEKFNKQSPHHNFHPYYGPHDDGFGVARDVTNPDNVSGFLGLIEQHRPQGLDLFVADGGFSTEGQENRQELVMRQLILCQFLIGLGVLRQGGSFVCKIFDNYLPYTVELLFMMGLHFASVTVMKPLTSRPANSERYLVGQGLLRRSPPVVGYMRHVNGIFNDLQAAIRANVDTARLTPREPVHLFPPEAIGGGFLEYIRRTNIRIAQQQRAALEELIKYIRDPTLQPVQQATIQEDCYQMWGLPVCRPPHPLSASLPIVAPSPDLT